jgi:DNA-binding transcriptional regulator YiaG
LIFFRRNFQKASPDVLSRGISPKTVQAWEQGSREPGDAALKLLTIAKKHPKVSS